MRAFLLALLCATAAARLHKTTTVLVESSSSSINDFERSAPTLLDTSDLLHELIIQTARACNRELLVQLIRIGGTERLMDLELTLLGYYTAYNENDYGAARVIEVLLEDCESSTT